jgi:AcrR family transcriptional regulator
MPRGKFDRSARKAHTRSCLLDAAARVYARSGFAGATLEEVASDAGFTKGAVYAHFGSKENLLLALVEEHLAGQVAEQLELFDRERATWERPLAGSERWMEGLQREPDRFRLFIELWAQAQRDEQLRLRLAAALAQLRATFAGFAAASAADAGLEPPARAAEQFANVMLALGLGLGMLELTDPGAVSPTLLGATISVLIRTMETSPEARELIAGFAAAREGVTTPETAGA